MKVSRLALLITCAWVFFVGGYVAVILLASRDSTVAGLSYFLACIVPLFANTCLLWNAASPYRRLNGFWMLLALGCTLWLAGILVLVYTQFSLHQESEVPFIADLLFFLHTVPFIASLALMPHARKMRETLRFGLIDLVLLGILWLYVYIFAAMPWKVVSPNPELFHSRDFASYLIENLVVAVGFGLLFLRTRGAWRTVYGHLFGATSLYVTGMTLSVMAMRHLLPNLGGLIRLPMLASFVWLGTVGIIAHGLAFEPEVQQPAVQRDTQWPARLAMWGVLAAPLLAAWSEFASTAPDAVKSFRLIVTLVAIFVGAALVFLRQYLVYQERTGLVHELWESLENVKRLQTHFVQSEKLASLGQLAAGAAHEINNPLTAILGYADVLTIENAANTRAHSLGDKIREQARRTKDLVNNLLSFARQVPAEKQLLDLNSVLTGAVQLRNLDLRGKNIRIELENRSILPAVRGDPNQLLQVFYHLISNAVDAMESAGGGVLLIRTLRERGNVVIEFSDTGPGMKEPEKVFDPFYTTKEVGKGTGLGLSICYGVMEEHGGRITGFNRPEGGCTFRLELPAILAVFPQTSTLPAAPVNTR
ncbi:MAG TPA: HAMP domain-containing sensor histidine kinase [Candidatus Acidoferrales bacterium]|nr:HAMP domain-containing sensor histidine kinase [Candidatus Acidoferrales bacterium]